MVSPRCFHGNERGARLGLAFAMGNDGRVSENLDRVPAGAEDAPWNAAPLALSDRPTSRKGNVMAATGLVASFLIAVLTAAPAGFAIAEPGPTYDTLGTVNGQPLLQIAGEETYDTTGELRLVTVSFSDASSRPFTVGRVLQAFFSPSRSVSPVEDVFGTPEQQDDEKAASAQQWISSQEAATVSAVEARGDVVPAVISVAGVLEESHAAGLLLDGDVLTAGNGDEFVSYSDLSRFLDGRKPGDIVTMTVDRAGETQDVSFELMSSEDGKARMGIYVDPTFDLPIDVSVDIDRVGGPSAGLMFALSIMDRLSPEDELDGAHVAGTGEIEADGDVYPIGGIRHKMYGASADGADYFLAPVENCPEVVGHIPDGLSVYAVDTLADAYEAIVAIGKKDTAKLPTCSATPTT